MRALIQGPAATRPSSELVLLQLAAGQSKRPSPEQRETAASAAPPGVQEQQDEEATMRDAIQNQQVAGCEMPRTRAILWCICRRSGAHNRVYSGEKRNPEATSRLAVQGDTGDRARHMVGDLCEPAIAME